MSVLGLEHSDFRLRITQDETEVAHDSSLWIPAYDYASSLIGDFTIAIGKLDYFSDLYWTGFAQQYPQFVKEEKLPAPFSDAGNRSEWIERSVQWFSKKHSANFNQGTTCILKSMALLFNNRNKILHAHLYKLELGIDPKLYFLKWQKVGDRRALSNGSKTYTKFKSEGHKFRASELLDMTANARNCEEAILDCLRLAKINAGNNFQF